MQDSKIHSKLFIYFKGREVNGILNVGNIVPQVDDGLSMDEYNNILDSFRSVVIGNYEKNYNNITIEYNNSNVFEPLSVISDQALRMLETFCKTSNKSTGSHHQSDRDAWYDFIIQTVKDEQIFDGNILSDFLSDEDYWGKKTIGYLGVMGRFAWSNDVAKDLATEYADAVSILQYYREKNNV